MLIFLTPLPLSLLPFLSFSFLLSPLPSFLPSLLPSPPLSSPFLSLFFFQYSAGEVISSC